MIVTNDETDLHGEKPVKRSTSADKEKTSQPPRKKEVRVKEGDFILLDYTVEIVDDKRVIDTTIEEVAKEHALYRENEVYEPRLVVVGKGFLLKSVEEELVGSKEEEKKVIVLPPEKAFGTRDPRKVRVIPATELSRRGIIPRVGMQVELNGNIATIRSVGGGRVQLDFNHPLAGKRLKYTVVVRKLLKTTAEKVKALIKRRIPGLKVEDVKVRKEGNSLKILLPEDALYYERLGLGLRGIALDIKRYLPEKVEAVTFTISIPIAEKTKEAKAKEQE
ncbi:MAG: hypothetical protein DRJ51_01240 [Thermoprotei archaeon]|nr:MAG: hypothetical protein DRJ51_01240 [Thermoprotei archaeon]RLF03474.1 MAG: hypothetical protein DRJ59_00550 [Thermoprotei archaeon]